MHRTFDLTHSVSFIVQFQQKFKIKSPFWRPIKFYSTKICSRVSKPNQNKRVKSIEPRLFKTRACAQPEAHELTECARSNHLEMWRLWRRRPRPLLSIKIESLNQAYNSFYFYPCDTYPLYAPLDRIYIDCERDLSGRIVRFDLN